MKSGSKNPCWQCEERSPGCHAVCERYGAWKTEHEKQREETKQKRLADADADGYTIDLIVGMKKKKRR